MRRAGAANDDINRGKLGFPMIEINRASAEFIGQILGTIVGRLDTITLRAPR